MPSSSTHDDDENKKIDATLDQVSSSSTQTNTNVATSASAASTIITPLHIVDDADEGLPLPIGMAENISNAAEPPKQIGKVELIDDDGPALPPALEDAFDDSPTKMAVSSAAASIELVNELSPPTPFNIAQFDDGDDALTKKIVKEEDMNKKPAAIMADEDLIHVPTRQDIEGCDIQSVNTNRGDGSDNRRGWGDIESRGGGIRSQPVQTQQGGNNMGESNINNHPTNDMIQPNITAANIQVIGDEGQADIHIPEAFLVDDMSVYDERTIYDATPTLPWWKQRRTKIMLAVVFILFAALVIALGVTLSRPDPDPVIIRSAGSNIPTKSLAPSVSLAPSSSPSECALTISTNVQKLDMSKVDKPFETKIAMDKLNAVVVTRESGTTNVHIMFYLLKEDRWESNNHYIENYGEVATFNGNWDPSRSKISVALSGKIAMVGFPFSNIDGLSDSGSAGLVFVFEQNDFGVWEKGDLLPIPQRENGSGNVYAFGYSIDIDGDAAIVLSGFYFHVLENHKGKWKETQRLELPGEGGWEAFISGDTIAIQMSDERIDIYKYDQFSKSYNRIQDTLIGSYISMSFNQDYLAYSTLRPRGSGSYCLVPEGFYVYHQQDLSQSYHQTYVVQDYHNLTSDGCIPRYRGDGYIDYTTTSIDQDYDHLVVGGVNKTHIYIQNIDGYWEERLMLNNWYRQYQVSERNILAATYNETTNEDEVYYFNIENCANTPTQVPSSSAAPSSSSHPTQTSTIEGTEGATHTPPNPFRTYSPTNSIYRYFCSNVSIASNTSIPQSLPSETCYWVDLVVAFDNEPVFSVWDIQKVNYVGDNEVLKIYRGTSDDILQIRKDSICLTAGVYQFTMHDEKPTGGGLSYPGYYSVSSGGDIITQGREFFDQCNATATFSLPLTAAPSMMPSDTLSPTVSPSFAPSVSPSESPTISPTVTSNPSMLPTISSQPTITCYWIEIMVVFDEYPLDTSWQIQKIINSGDNKVLRTFNGTSDERNELHNKSMCLEGEQAYQFTIYDDYGDGITAPGHYNVTSNGSLIVQGGKFGLGEITSFPIPFIPGSSMTNTITREPTASAQTLMPTTPFPTESPPTILK